MKYKFLILLLFVLSSVCSAQEFSKGGLRYRVIGPGNDVAVIGMVKEASEVIIPEQVAYKGKNYTVKAIGEYAFQYETIIKVVIPDNVTDIGGYAFRAEGEGLLSEIILPANLEHIGPYAFENQCKLEEVRFPAKLKAK